MLTKEEQKSANVAAKKELAPEYDSHDNLDLRGTLASVMILGGIMLIVWFAIFILFIERI